MIQFPEALATIHDAFAEPATFKPQVGSPFELRIVRSDVPGENFGGPGPGPRKLVFEARASDFAEAPQVDDEFETEEAEWRVINVEVRSDIGAFTLTVELIEV